MITYELLKQAIKETAEGMLSGDPDYAAKCVTLRDGGRVRVIMRDRQSIDYFYFSQGTWLYRRVSFNGNLNSDSISSHDLIPARRQLKCWVRWYLAGSGHPAVCFSEQDTPFRQWLTDPVEVVAEEKMQS
ncbi:MAG: hypothetical protein KGL39_13985 [Patescibacteria group bacterium]|nr:hypothetical protein [Patescibacteria group bacterium]